MDTRIQGENVTAKTVQMRIFMVVSKLRKLRKKISADKKGFIKVLSIFQSFQLPLNPFASIGAYFSCRAGIHVVYGHSLI